MILIRSMSALIVSITVFAGCTADEDISIESHALGPDACLTAVLDVEGVCRAFGGDPVNASCCRQDIRSTDLSFDVATRSATAIVEVSASKHRSVVLEAGDLTIQSVLLGSQPLDFTVGGSKLVVSAGGAPTFDWANRAPPSLTIHYAFAVHNDFDGFMDSPLSDVSFTWPEFCGNLFPCSSLPSDGIEFRVAVTGVPEGQTAIYPATVTASAPSYMAAFAIGNYGYQRLGATSAGTEVGVYYLDGGRDEALAATATLPAAFEFYESTYGPYAFGDRVASVSVDWGGESGGMEHHPFWHIARESMAGPAVHHHEAAHGWFGNGVRLKCREDFVLSEGTVSYLEARAHEATGGDPTPFWTNFQGRLERAIARRDLVVYPDGCNGIDSLLDIFTTLPYMKGAFFFRQVEHRVGRLALDAALSSFYRGRVGAAARMQELIDHIERATGFQLDDLETGWLKSKGIPCVLRNGDCVPQ
jgi:aminopeptidase N